MFSAPCPRSKQRSIHVGGTPTSTAGESRSAVARASAARRRASMSSVKTRPIAPASAAASRARHEERIVVVAATGPVASIHAGGDDGHAGGGGFQNGVRHPLVIGGQDEDAHLPVILGDAIGLDDPRDDDFPPHAGGVNHPLELRTSGREQRIAAIRLAHEQQVPAHLTRRPYVHLDQATVMFFFGRNVWRRCRRRARFRESAPIAGSDACRCRSGITELRAAMSATSEARTRLSPLTDVARCARRNTSRVSSSRTPSPSTPRMLATTGQLPCSATCRHRQAARRANPWNESNGRRASSAGSPARRPRSRTAAKWIGTPSSCDGRVARS